MSVWVSCAFADPLVERPGPGIEIRRTTDGIPHILAHSWHDLGYGYGYAQAEDALCTWQKLLSLFVAAEHIFSTLSLGPGEIHIGRWRNIELDFFFRTFADDHRVRSIETISAELIQLIRGFAAGYNRYLGDVRKLAHSPLAKQKPCLGEPWIDEITPDDVYRRVLR